MFVHTHVCIIQAVDLREFGHDKSTVAERDVNSRQSLLTTPGDDGGRDQVLSRSTDDCRLLITLSVQRNGRLGVRQRRAVHRRHLIHVYLLQSERCL